MRRHVWLTYGIIRLDIAPKWCQNGAMDLRPYVETIHHQLMVAAEAGGDEARAVAERLTAAVDSTVRLALQDALVAAAEEITFELAPGSVELRLRGRDPEFVVRQAAGFAVEPSGAGRDQGGSAEALAGPVARSEAAADADEGGMARVNLRLQDQLKARAEQAAANERLSLNAWLVKAVLGALDRSAPPKRDGSGPPSRQRYVGWAR
jgi:HicB family